MKQRLRMLVTVKAYPSISKRKGETVCVAGLREHDDGRVEWARLWPVPFRDMAVAERFSIWQWIELDAHRTSSDARPESWRPIADSIVTHQQISTRGAWRERLRVLDPIMLGSMCELRRKQEADGTSLAAFRPHDGIEVSAEPNEPWSAEHEAVAAQGSLLMPDKRPLEWIATRFRFHYTCGDAEPTCSGHAQTVVDWGLLQLYRSSKRRNGPAKAEADVLQKMRDIAGPSKDTIFFVGNQHQARRGWMVIGMAYPPMGSEGHADQLGLEFL